MKIPAFFYGLTRDVERRSKKGFTALRRGASLFEIVESDNLFNTEDHDGLLVLDGPHSLLGSDPQFHMYLFMRTCFNGVLNEKLSKKLEKDAFLNSLETAWGLLGVLGPNNSACVDDDEVYIPFLNANLKYWEILLGEGKRFSFGSRTGKSLSELPTTLTYVLAKCGIPVEKLAHVPKTLEEVTPLIEEALSKARPT